MLSLSITRLRTVSWKLTVTQGTDKQPVPLAGKVLWFFAKHNIADTDARAIIRKNSAAVGGITITDAPNGLAQLSLQPADTEGLILKASTILQCSLVLVDGSAVYELDNGTLQVIGNIEVPE